MNRTLISIFWVIIGLSNMPNATSSTYPLTPEKASTINLFWQNVEQRNFLTTDNTNIAYATNLKRPETAFIIIVPGRSESYLKYQELMYDFDTLGYDSIIIDHRGQGLSQRLVDNKYQGYVDNFDDYASDLNQLLVDELPKQFPAHQEAPMMLAHSMGGAIALRYLQLHQHNITSAVLASPMISIDSGGIPDWLARSIIKTGTVLNHWFSKAPWYFMGQNDNNESSFQENPLMHSQARFQRLVELYDSNQKIQLGGVTFHWLNEAIKANNAIFSDLNKLELPILLFQAGDEKIVDNAAQDAFCQQLHLHNSVSCPNGKPVIFPGAYHELFFELDEHRDLAIKKTLMWFEQHKK